MKQFFTVLCFIAACIFAKQAIAAPSTAAIPATELFREGTLSQIKFSPDGQHISVVVNYPDGRGIAFYDEKTNEFQLIVRVAQTDWIHRYYWLDSTHLYVAFGDSDSQIHTIITVRDDQGKLSFESKNVPKNGYVVGQLDGSPTQLLFATDVGRYEVEIRLYKVSIEQLLTGKFNPEDRVENLLNTDAATRLVYSSKLNRLISIRLDAETKRINVHYRELNSDKWLPLYSYDPVDFEFIPQQFLAEDTLAVLTNKNSDKMALYEFNVKTQTLEKLIFEHPRYDLISANYDDGQLASVSYLAHGRLEQQFFTEQQQKLQQQLNQFFKDEQWRVIATHVNDHLLFVFSATNPGQYFLYPQDKKPQLIGSVLPELIKFQLAPSIKLNAQSRDGLPIEALLTLPTSKTKTPPPLIVMPHGGPIGIQETDGFDPTVQFLASRGYAVLRTNFRGSAGYGKSFSKKGVAALGEGIEQDIQSAVDLVRKEYKTERACAMGYSYGGYSAMMLAIKESEFYRCVIAGYGIYDLPLLFNASNIKIQPEQRIRVERVVGPLTPTLKARSPVYMANKIKAPVLLIGGMEDDIAGFEQTHRMFDALKRSGKSVQEMFYQETGHGHDRWDLEHHQIGLIEQFLSQNLATNKTLSTAEQAEQWYRHAQLLTEGDKLDKDQSAAIKLFEKAAAAGHVDAKVELGKAMLNGDGLPKDFNKGISYLQDAASKNSANAELFLGKVFSSGLYAPTDPVKANQHFSRAAALEPDSIAPIYLARAACLGFAQPVNWQLCIQKLTQQLNDYRQHFADSKTIQLNNAARRVIAEVLLDAKPSGDVRDQLIAILQSTVKKPIATNVKVAGLRFGLFDKDTYKYQDEAIYPATNTNEFGSLVKPMRADNFTKDAEAWLLVRWQRTLPNGRVQIIFDNAIPVVLNDKLQLHSKLEFAMDQQPAAWQVQVFDLQGNNLYQQEFVFK